MWIDVVNGYFLPRSSRYRYYRFDILHMQQLAQERITGSIDYWTHIYKPRIGDIVVDVGAGIGIDALALSPFVGAGGRIYSIEAHPWTFQALQKTKELNGLENVTAFQLAIADGPGKVWISDSENDEGNDVSRYRDSQHCIAIPSLDLDAFMAANNIRHINLLKMNIEGAEELAIRGMNRCIRKIDHAVIACHDFRGDLAGTKRSVINFLMLNGFEVFERSEDPRPYVRDHVHARRITCG